MKNYILSLQMLFALVMGTLAQIPGNAQPAISNMPQQEANVPFQQYFGKNYQDQTKLKSWGHTLPGNGQNTSVVIYQQIASRLDMWNSALGQWYYADSAKYQV